MTDSPVARLLGAAGVTHHLHRHRRPVRSLEQAAAERGLDPQQIVRSLLFRLEAGTFVLVLAPGPEKIAWPALRRHLGVTRIATATPDEVLEVTGYRPGAVSPLGLPAPLRTIADRRLLGWERVSIGAGIPNAGIELSTGDLLRLTEAELADLG